jgi:predicted membrane-bound spermidine synthase
MSTWSGKADRLYFGDLLGAGTGCLALFLALPVLCPIGTSIAVAAAALGAALILSRGGTARSRSRLCAALALCVLCAYPAGRLIPVTPMDHKRVFKKDYSSGNIVWTRWGVLSRVDVARWSRDLKMLWIDGGSNQSSLIHFSGDYVHDFNTRQWEMSRDSLIYRLRKPGRVAVIGAAGSHEVVAAAGFGADDVTGIEMDPLVVRVVIKDFADFIGRPYDRPHVRMICAEGRSYLERNPETYDVIQQVNNFTPVAMASGALNVSETYLVTVEAFRLYLKRLSPDGIIDIRRHGDIRVASVAMEAFRREGVRDPWRHIVIFNDEVFVKKSPWTAAELDHMRRLAKEMRLEVRFSPDGSGEAGSWYYGFLKSDNPRKWYRKDVAILAPSTDDWPFINHYVSWGLTRNPNLPKTISWYNGKKVFKRIPHGDVVLVLILIEAAVLSAAFLFLPLRRSRSGGLTRPSLAPVSYFGCLGIGFIFVEICLMQRLTLLLGHPSLSLAVVLFSLLAFAGLGSLASRRLGADTPTFLKTVLLVNIAIILAAAALLPPVVRGGLTLPTVGRVALAVAVTGLQGFFLGMPFPVSVRIAGRNLPGVIPWGWAVNAYATVVGSVLSVMLAMTYGFSTVYLLAAGAYALAFLACRSLAGRACTRGPAL